MSAALPPPPAGPRRATSGPGPDARLPGWLFPSAAAAAVLLHALRLYASPGLHGGGDLLPHLRLIELMGQEPALRNVYPPAYHAIGALLAAATGLEHAPKLFAVLAAALSLVAFRFFQRSARLPDHAALLFAAWPFGFTLSWSMPKAEVLGYALIFLALGMLVRRSYWGAALALAAAFWVHVPAALLLGLSGGILCLALRDARGLVALAAGTLGALPLIAAHLDAGCSFREALVAAEGDYLHATRGGALDRWPLILALASPPMLGAALLGARATWRRHRPFAVLCAALVLLYFQELWLVPFGTFTSLDLVRGLSLLGVPASIAAGVHLAARPRAAPWVLATAALWCVGTTFTLAQRPLYWRPIALEEIRDLRVLRCRFGWSAPNAAHHRDPRLRGPQRSRRRPAAPPRTGSE